MNYTNKINNYKEECLSYMSKVGLPFDGKLIIDGQIHRYSADAKKNKPDEYYVATEGYSSRGNYFLGCAFGSWSDDSKHQYKSWGNVNKYDESERKELRKITDEQRLKAKQNIEVIHNDTAKKAQKLWETYSTLSPSEKCSRYLEFKKIKPIGGIRFGLNPQGYPSIVIPIENVNKELRSLQYISLDNNERSYKNFLSGGELKGNFHVIGKISGHNVIFIVEGYATGVSIFEATGGPVAIAFSAGGLEKVTENIKKKFPQISITIAGDSDDVGRKKAKDVAAKFGCTVVFPVFPKDTKKKECSDFNDLHQICSRQELQKQLTQKTSTNMNKKLAANYLLDKEDPCKDFNLLTLPEPLREYITSICRTTSAHPIMITASVITMISAFLGTKVFISDNEYFQKLYSNLWMLSITISGQFKTTALNKGSKIAFDRQAAIFKEMNYLKNSSLRDENIKKNILDKSRENIILPTRITAEALLEHLSQGHEGAIFASEFGGWLQNLNRNHNNDFKAILADFYDVPMSYRYKTKTQGDCIIERPFISICGVSTLSWIKSNFEPMDVSSGFFARLLIFAPPYNDQMPPALPDFSTDHCRKVEEKFKKYIDIMIEDIGEKRSYRLTENARECFERYHDNIYNTYCISNKYNTRTKEILQPYLKRWSPDILKLAMIMQLFIDSKSEMIHEGAIISAWSILLPAMKSTATLFEGELGESPQQKKCRIIHDFIGKKNKETGDPVKRPTIMSSKKLDGGSKEYDYVLETLIEEGKIVCNKVGLHKNEWEYSFVEKIERN